MTIIPHEENSIELNLDLLALDLTNDPNPVRYHGVAPELEKEKPVVALLRALPGLWVDTAYAQGATEKLYFFINDHLGAPQKVVDEAGVVVWDGDYWPFGNVDVNVGTYGNRFRFPGQYYDQETRLHYNWHRFYNPGTGRYLRADPIGHFGELNLYVYVGNNPTIFIDPYGLIRWRTVGKGATSAVFGTIAVVGGATVASTPTGIGQVIGVTGVLAGSSMISYGVSQIITGFTHNEIPFMGTKEAVIQGTTSGITQRNLLAANELLDMLPGIVSGRLNVQASKFGEALDIIQYGLSIGKSVDKIQNELKDAGLLKPIGCKE